METSVAMQPTGEIGVRPKKEDERNSHEAILMTTHAYLGSVKNVEEM
jgi:hypothetical protein